MIYTTLDTLPEAVRRVLDSDSQAVWMDAYNTCYAETGDDRKALVAAWGALAKVALRRTLALKRDGDRLLIGGWGILFTDAADPDPDADDQWFSADTRLFLNTAGRSLWYEHGEDPDYGAALIGERTRFELYPRGLWVEHALYPAHPLAARTVAEIEAGLLAYSSDSVLHYVRAGYDPSTGYLGLWPLAGFSLTKTPAEPALGPVTFDDFMTAVKRAAATAREAHAPATTPVSPVLDRVSPEKETPKIMNPEELLALVAQALGVEPTIESVQAALEALMTALQSPDAAESDAAMPDPAQLRTALGLEPDADDATVLERLGAIAAMLQPEAVETGAAKSAAFDYAAFARLSAAAAKSTPAQPVAALTPDVRPAPAAKRTRHLGVLVPKKHSLVEGLAKMLEGDTRALKSMGYTIGANGGWLANREVAADILELFYANEVCIAAGATVVPMDGIETLTYRKMLTGSTARWGGEAQTVTGTDPSTGLVNLSLKELVGAVRVSNRLLKNGAANVESVVRNDIEKAMRLAADLGFLRGSGGKPTGSSGAEPTGIRNTAGVTVTALGANGRTPTPKDFIDAWGRLEDANVPASDTWGAIMSPRTKRVIENTTDTTGQILPVERFSRGYQVLATTQIPNNLTAGSNSDTSEIYYGAWEYLIIGMGQDIEFTVDSSRYVDTRETLIQAVMYVDAAASHSDAFEVVTGARG